MPVEDILRVWRNVSPDYLTVEEKYSVKEVVGYGMALGRATGYCIIYPHFEFDDIDQTKAFYSELGDELSKKHLEYFKGFRAISAGETRGDTKPKINIKGGEVEIDRPEFMIQFFGMQDFSGKEADIEETRKLSVLKLLRCSVERYEKSLDEISIMIQKSNIDVLYTDLNGAESDNNITAQTITSAMEKLAEVVAKAGSNHPLVVTSGDKLERLSVGNGDSLTKLLYEFKQDIAGACRIPMTRLFMEQSKGLGETGSGDEKIYYDMVGALRETRVTVPLNQIDWIIQRLEGLDESTSWDYNSLFQKTDKQKLEELSLEVDILLKLLNSGIPSIVAKVMTKLNEIGYLDSFTDVEIKVADDTFIPDDSDIDGGV